jgi:tetratricopeptide (TPR) repeat protein
MSKKSPSKKSPGRLSKKESTEYPGPGPSDKIMADLGRLLAEQEFASVDEINDFLEQRLASGQPIPSRETQTPLEQAQDLMYDAWDAPNKAQRIKLAREALTLSEDCADAYVLLALESTRSLKQARNLYESGVKAGERSLGTKKFKEFEGHFWGVLETRPYMRAREGLAACLWQLGQRQEAIDHYHEMLRLNPGDNQGVRYVLLGCLLEEHKQSETEKLLEAYGDGSASWSYNHALFLFRQEGAGRKADSRLRQALADNPHVPDYLFGYKRLPHQLPPYMGFGDEDEAAYYVTDAQHLWLQEKGALDWLREISAKIL